MIPNAAASARRSGLLRRLRWPWEPAAPQRRPSRVEDRGDGTRLVHELAAVLGQAVEAVVHVCDAIGSVQQELPYEPVTFRVGDRATGPRPRATLVQRGTLEDRV